MIILQVVYYIYIIISAVHVTMDYIIDILTERLNRDYSGTRLIRIAAGYLNQNSIPSRRLYWHFVSGHTFNVITV